MGGKTVQMSPQDVDFPSLRRALIRMVERHFRGMRVCRVLAGTDRVRHQTAAILRVLLSAPGGRRLAAVIVYPPPVSVGNDRVLASLVLWWDELTQRSKRIRVALILPTGGDERITHCLRFLRIPVETYRYQLSTTPSNRLQHLDPADLKRSEIRSPYVVYPYRPSLPPVLSAVRRSHSGLETSFRHGSWQLSYRGLPVLWQKVSDGSFWFDWLGARPFLSPSEPALKRHLEAVRQIRRFPSPDPRHPYYCCQPERWLETMLVRNLSRINSQFEPTVYYQVPSLLDGKRKVLDLLTLTRNKRLAVLELKVVKSLGLIFQALDYWERVCSHLANGDFQQVGYFPGLQLDVRPPRLYLVAPLFEFHRVLPVMRRHLKPKVVFDAVGLNSDWKRGLKVLRRFRF